MTIPQKPMTVVELKVDSFKRLAAAHVRPQKTGLVPVRGKNGAGKSALLESMLAALGGKRAEPAVPINTNANHAEVVLDLGEIIIKRRWKRDSAGKGVGALTVEAKDRSKITSPQAILDNLVGRFADPVAFLEMKPEDQAKTVLGVLGLDAELARLEERAREEFELRRDAGRDLDRCRQTVASLETEVQGLPTPEVEGTAQEVMEQLHAANQTNNAIDVLEQRLESATREGQGIQLRIQALEEQIRILNLSKEETADRWKEAKANLKGLVRIDTEPFKRALEAHHAAASTQGRRDLLERATIELGDAIKIHDQLEIDLKATREEIAQLLGGAKFPIEGMAYDHEKKMLLLNGLPLDQASQGEAIAAAAAIAMAGNPIIRIIFVRVGSLWDSDSLGKLAEIAEASGFQVWVEQVADSDDGTGIWIEDGMAHTHNAKKTTTP